MGAITCIIYISLNSSVSPTCIISEKLSSLASRNPRRNYEQQILPSPEFRDCSLEEETTTNKKQTPHKTTTKALAVECVIKCGTGKQ